MDIEVWIFLVGEQGMLYHLQSLIDMLSCCLSYEVYYGRLRL